MIWFHVNAQRACLFPKLVKNGFSSPFLEFRAALGFIFALGFTVGTVLLELAEESKNRIKTVFDHC
jgi:hypothetical protein